MLRLQGFSKSTHKSNNLPWSCWSWSGWQEIITILVLVSFININPNKLFQDQNFRSIIDWHTNLSFVQIVNSLDQKYQTLYPKINFLRWSLSQKKMLPTYSKILWNRWDLMSIFLLIEIQVLHDCITLLLNLSQLWLFAATYPKEVLAPFIEAADHLKGKVIINICTSASTVLWTSSNCNFAVLIHFWKKKKFLACLIWNFTGISSSLRL